MGFPLGYQRELAEWGGLLSWRTAPLCQPCRLSLTWESWQRSVPIGRTFLLVWCSPLLSLCHSWHNGFSVLLVEKHLGLFFSSSTTCTALKRYTALHTTVCSKSRLYGTELCWRLLNQRYNARDIQENVLYKQKSYISQKALSLLSTQDSPRPLTLPRAFPISAKPGLPGHPSLRSLVVSCGAEAWMHLLHGRHNTTRALLYVIVKQILRVVAAQRRATPRTWL